MKRQRVFFPILFLLIFTSTACSTPSISDLFSSSTTPPTYGIFIEQDGSLVELKEYEGDPDSQSGDGIPVINEDRPEFIVWLPQIDLAYFSLQSARTNEDISFTITSQQKEEVLIFQPKTSLEDGRYCFIQGDPLGSPYSLPHWCFTINNGEQASSDDSGGPKSQADSPLETAPSEPNEKVCPADVQARLYDQDLSDLVPGAVLEGCDFANMNLVEIDLAGAGLQGSIFSGADLSGANLSEADLSNANLDRAELFKANLQGANISNIDFTNTAYKEANLSGANGIGTTFKSSELEEAKTENFEIIKTMLILTGQEDSGSAIGLGNIFDIAWNSTSEKLSVLSEKGVSLWDTKTGSLLDHGDYYGARSDFSPATPKRIFWYSYSDILFVGTGSVVEMYDTKEELANNSELAEWVINGNVRDISICPDIRYIASSSENTIAIYDQETDDFIKTIDVVMGEIQQIEWSPNGIYLAAAGDNGVVKIFEKPDFREVGILRHANKVSHITWSPDSSKLATLESLYGGNNVIRTWDPATSKKLQEFEIKNAEDVEWDPSGNWLAVAGGIEMDTVMIIDSQTGEIEAAMGGHEGISSVSWSPGGTRLATGDEKQVRIWPFSVMFPDLDQPRFLEMIFVPGGNFSMGGDAEQAYSMCKEISEPWTEENICNIDTYKIEEPVHKVDVEDFHIDKYEVTIIDYKRCVELGDCQLPSLLNEVWSYNSLYDSYPVFGVDWTQAQTYCESQGKQLPTEAEWEKAARGDQGNLYPWGNQFNGKLANFCDRNCNKEWANESVNDRYKYISPVGAYPSGASPYGALDMAGNVWEWTSTKLAPYRDQDTSTQNESGVSIILKGGAWDVPGHYIRPSARFSLSPEETFVDVGFRCVRH